MSESPSKYQLKKEWEKGFRDGLAYAVEQMAQYRDLADAQFLLDESGFAGEILDAIKENNPEIYEDHIKGRLLNSDQNK